MEFTISAMSVQSLGNTHLRPQRPQAANPERADLPAPRSGSRWCLFLWRLCLLPAVHLSASSHLSGLFPHLQGKDHGLCLIRGFQGCRELTQERGLAEELQK